MLTLVATALLLGASPIQNTVAGNSKVQHLTCTEEASVAVQNVGEGVEVKQHKPEKDLRAYLVIDLLKSRLGIASNVVPEMVYAQIGHAEASSIRKIGGTSSVATSVWAIDTKRMKALYVRALAGGDYPGFVGALEGKMVYYHCVAGWPAEMLKAERGSQPRPRSR